jgi:methyltransferase-like protein 6
VHDLTLPEPSLRAKLSSHPSFSDPDGVDVCTCLFVLSAIPPEKLQIAARSIAEVRLALFEVVMLCRAGRAQATKPGGVLLFRDYGLHDSAQLRFHTRASAGYSEPSRLQADAPLYRRADQTMTYFFTVRRAATLLNDAMRRRGAQTDELERLFGEAGLVGSARVVTRDLANRREGWTIERRFVQGRWQKPLPCSREPRPASPSLTFSSIHASAHERAPARP